MASLYFNETNYDVSGAIVNVSEEIELGSKKTIYVNYDGEDEKIIAAIEEIVEALRNSDFPLTITLKDDNGDEITTIQSIRAYYNLQFGVNKTRNLNISER